MLAPIRTKYLYARYSEGRVIFFMTGKPDRKCPPDFLRPEQVPEPEKGDGWFECRRTRIGPWMSWTVLRRVEEPQAGGPQETIRPPPSPEDAR